MTDRTWLLIDSSNLAYRSFYSMGNLSYDGVKTGVVFGFLKEVKHLQKLYNPYSVVFTFDVGESFRTNILPTYKSTRKILKEEQTSEQKEMDVSRDLYYKKGIGEIVEVKYKDGFFQIPWFVIENDKSNNYY